MSKFKYRKLAIYLISFIAAASFSSCKDKGFKPDKVKIDAAQINQDIKKNIEDAEKITDENEKSRLYGIASRLLCKKGDFNQASVIARLSQKANPSNKDAMITMGEYFLNIKQFKEAHESLSTVLSDYPDDPDANYLMGNTLAAMGKFSEAASRYKNNINSKDPAEEAYINLAYTYKQLGDDDKAFSLLSSYIKSSQTKNAYIYKNAGILAESLDEKEKAKEYYTQYLKLNPYSDDREVVTKWRDSL